MGWAGARRWRGRGSVADGSCRDQTPDSKKEEFRKYLEKSGVIDAFTKGACGDGPRRVRRWRVGGVPAIFSSPLPRRPAVLVGLYEQPTRPTNAVECVPPRRQRRGSR